MLQYWGWCKKVDIRSKTLNEIKRFRYTLEKYKIEYFTPNEMLAGGHKPWRKKKDSILPVFGMEQKVLDKLVTRWGELFTSEYIIPKKSKSIYIEYSESGIEEKYRPILKLVPCTPTRIMSRMQSRRKPVSINQVIKQYNKSLDEILKERKILFNGENNSNPRVSVVVPVYNTEKYLVRCLESLVNQSLDEIEIIVVNDGSTDNSQEIIERFKSKYPSKIVSVENKNQGIGPSRNEGIQLSRGEYIAFLDSDDYALPYAYELLWKKAKAGDSNLVIGQYYRHNALTGKEMVPQKDFLDCTLGSIYEHPEFFVGGKIYCWNKLYGRSIFQEKGLKFPAVRDMEDNEFYVEAMLKAERISYVDLPLFSYTVNRTDSVMTDFGMKDIDRVFRGFRATMGRIASMDDRKAFEDELTEMIRRSLSLKLRYAALAYTEKEAKEVVDTIFDFMEETLPKWNKTKYYKKQLKDAKGVKKARLKRDTALAYYLKRNPNINGAKGKLSAYPRPNLVRESYICLNGKWDYVITKSVDIPETYEGKINVPYSPEAELSGVSRQLKPDEFLHYRHEYKLKDSELNTLKEYNKRLVINFGAVDQNCQLYINGDLVLAHRGGYTPFSCDITDSVSDDKVNIQLVVTDPSEMGFGAIGKQKLKRRGMYYTAQSGIWQTVWMEIVPKNRIEKIKCVPDLDKGIIKITVKSAPGTLYIGKILYQGQTIAEDSFESNEEKSVQLSSVRPWSPEHPNLYELELEGDGDKVSGYFAMRKYSLGKDHRGINRFMLNNKPYFLNGLLDQGYWQGGLYTPPEYCSYEDDIKRIKEIGYNCVRKHGKIEPLQWYECCDRLGIIVLQDFVNGGDHREWFTKYLPNIIPPLGHRIRDDVERSRRLFGREKEETRKLFVEEMNSTLELLDSIPSIGIWTIFNEGWGQFDSRKMVEYLWQRDDSRLIDGASGWYDQGAGHVYSIHNYFYPLRLKAQKKRLLGLTEYGGTAFDLKPENRAGKNYGYGSCSTKEAFSSKYKKNFTKKVLNNIQKGLSISIYTQLNDIEDEINGLYTYDRKRLKLDKGLVIELNSIINKMNQEAESR